MSALARSIRGCPSLALSLSTTLQHQLQQLRTLSLVLMVWLQAPLDLEGLLPPPPVPVPMKDHESARELPTCSKLQLLRETQTAHARYAYDNRQPPPLRLIISQGEATPSEIKQHLRNTVTQTAPLTYGASVLHLTRRCTRQINSQSHPNMGTQIRAGIDNHDAAPKPKNTSTVQTRTGTTDPDSELRTSAKRIQGPPSNLLL